MSQQQTLKHSSVEEALSPWRKWAKRQISPIFSKYPDLHSQVVQELDKLLFTRTSHDPPLSSQPAWQRLKGLYGKSHPYVKSVPSPVDCEVVRIANHSAMHTYICGLLETYGWDPVKCCDPSLDDLQKALPGRKNPGWRDGCIRPKIRSAVSGTSSSVGVSSVSQQANQLSLPSSGSTMPSSSEYSGDSSRPAPAVPATQVSVLHTAPLLASSQGSTSSQTSQVNGNQTSLMVKKEAPLTMAPSIITPVSFQPSHSSQPAALQVSTQTVPFSGVMSTGTSNVSSLGGNQTNGNPQQPRNLQTLSSPALNPNHSTEKSIFQQPKNRPATTGQSLMETSAVKLQAETSTSDVSAGSAKPQTPVAGGIFKSLPATKPFPGIQKENASISRPFEQSSTPNFQMNPFTFGQVPAKGGFSMLPGRPFSNASTTQFTTFAAPVPRDNDVHRISAAADPSTGRSIGQNDVAKTPAASPLNLMVGNPDSACPTSERRTHPTKTKEDIVLSPRLASQTASTGITYDEEGVVCQEVQGTHSQQVERLSARLADDLRPMLHEYVRDKLTATNRDAATHMQRRTRNLLGLQSNAHFGFSILRDVEVKTMERMTREASALIEVVLAQISDPAKNVTSQGFKRETEVVEEASTEGDRPAKRARTRKA